MDKIYKKYKKSGAYHRKLTKTREKYEKVLKQLYINSRLKVCEKNTSKPFMSPLQQNVNYHETLETTSLPATRYLKCKDPVSEITPDENMHILKDNNEKLSESLIRLSPDFHAHQNHQHGHSSDKLLRMWALRHNITHQALKDDND